MTKRILLITQYFYPENFKSNDIAFELVKKGYLVDALVSIPNYPEGRYYKGYGLFRKRIQNVNGVRIFRAFQFPRGRKPNSISLTLNYLTFVFSASLWALLLSIFRNYHCIIVHEPSPITQAIPALIIKKLRNTPIYLWVLDIWPDALKSSGGIKNTKLLFAVNCLVKLIYNRCKRILISSSGFSDLICRQGDYEDKLIYFPNWSDDILRMPLLNIPELPDGYKILMAGNLASAQQLESVMKAVIELKDITELKWIFIGDGSKKKWLDDFIDKNNLSTTVFALGRFPFEYMPSFFQAADALLITLKSEFPHLRAVVPARLQTYMASGKPVIGMIDGGAAKIIEESGCGYSVVAADYMALANLIRHRILPDKKTFAQMGAIGREYFTENFLKEKCINHLIEIIDGIRSEKTNL